MTDIDNIVLSKDKFAKNGINKFFRSCTNIYLIPWYKNQFTKYCIFCRSTIIIFSKLTVLEKFYLGNDIVKHIQWNIEINHIMNNNSSESYNLTALPFFWRIYTLFYLLNKAKNSFQNLILENIAYFFSWSK